MFVTVFPHTLHWAKPMGSLSYMLKCPDLCGVYDPGKEEKKIYVVNFYNLTSIHIFHDGKTSTIMHLHHIKLDNINLQWKSMVCNHVKVQAEFVKLADAVQNHHKTSVKGEFF
jgi:hypothetical protein